MTRILATAIVGAGFSFVYAVPIFFLWNWLVPSIFGLCSISYVESIGIACFFGILSLIRVSVESEYKAILNDGARDKLWIQKDGKNF